MSSKVCTKCGEEKGLEEFYKSNSSKDGRKSVCTTCEQSYIREYRQTNRKSLSEYNRQYREDNRDSISERMRGWREANKDKIAEYNREYQREYREVNKERRLEYLKERRASDPMFALAHRCRCRISKALNRKGFSKDSTTAEILGCTYEELMAHMEAQFTEGMSWDNRSEWHIDHIIPLASAESEEELMALCHYTNLQPLWAKDNISKGARLDWAA